MTQETQETQEWAGAAFTSYPTREAYEAAAAEWEAQRLKDVPRAIRAYTDALKRVKHYDRLCFTWRERGGGKNYAKCLRQASSSLALYERQRDDALAILQTNPDGVAWLAAQKAKSNAATERRRVRFTAQWNQGIIDEYLYIQDRMWQELTAWRLEMRYGHTRDAAACLATYRRARAEYDGLTATIRERDLWKAMVRRSQQLRRTPDPAIPPDPSPDAPGAS